MIYNLAAKTRDQEGEIIKFDQPKLMNFIKIPKIWSSMTYIKVCRYLSEERKNIISHFIVLSLFQEKPAKISRFYKCFDIILHVFANFPFDYENYYRVFVDVLINAKARNLREEVFIYIMMKSLAAENNEKMSQLEERIIKKFSFLLKQLYFGMEKRKILKYLAILVDLQTVGWNFENEKKALVIESLKSIESNISSREKLLDYPEDYLKTCTMNMIHLISLLNLDDSSENLLKSTFEYLNLDLHNYSSSISLSRKAYRHIPKNPWTTFKIQVDHLILSTTYKEEDFAGVFISHHTANYQDCLDLDVKIFHLKNQNMRHSVIHHLKQMTLRSKLASCKNFIQSLLGYYEIDEKIFVFLEPFHGNLIDMISKSNKTPLPENYLKRVTRKLISSFAKLEKNELFHGNLKPHHLLCNEKWDLRISGFPEIKDDLDKSFKFRTDLIQGCSGYNAPDVPDVYDPEFKYIRKKADVFALGMILLQMATLKKLDGINKDELRRDAAILNVRFQWLRELLKKMLVSSYEKRPLFEDLLKFYKTLFEYEIANKLD